MVLSIVIINYNSKSVLINCLRSIVQSNFNFKYEVFIIDNASSESIHELEKEFNLFRFIYNQANIGFAGANNIGIKKAAGKYILLLNPDTIVNRHSFQPMINYLDSNPDVGAAGCKIFNSAGEIERSVHSFPSIIKEFVHANEFIKPLLSYNSKLGKVFASNKNLKAFESYWNYDTVKEVDHVTGACMMVKREVIDKAGLLDEAFFIYNEEVEWSLRFKHYGYKTVFLPESNIIHLFGYSTKQKVQKQAVNRLLVERYRGMLYFFQKHYGVIKLCLLRVIILEGFAVRLLLNYAKTVSPVFNNEKTNLINERTCLYKIIKLVFMSDFDWRKNK
ncbi:MAG: glycosyltransferase family 2 protein [Ignavibacteria bacterium]